MPSSLTFLAVRGQWRYKFISCN